MKILGTVLIAGLVNLLLLFAAGRLAGGTLAAGRCIPAAILGAAFTGAPLLPGLGGLPPFIWQLCCLGAVPLTAFGIRPGQLPAALLFMVLHVSLGGLASAKENTASVVLRAAGLVLACLAAGKRGGFVPVQLHYGGKTLRLTALRDTGNTLTDPFTGGAVLVISAQAARELTGLTQQQLSSPLESVGTVPGLRLLPYRTVGNTGFLLAMRIPQVKIGSWQGSRLVAFSPQEFGERYQALTGGLQ